MAKFLNTQDISSEILKIIKEAKEQITFVTFSLEINPQIKEWIKTVSDKNKDLKISIIYGRTKLKQTEQNFIETTNSIKLYRKDNLHAKCFMNESMAVLGSMNFYDFSQQNNIEMGISVTKTDDQDLYEDILDHVLHIKKHSTEILNDLSTTNNHKNHNLKLDLSYKQMLIFDILDNNRKSISLYKNIPYTNFLNNNELRKIVEHGDIDCIEDLYDVLDERKIKMHGEEIMSSIWYSKKYCFFRVINIRNGKQNEYDSVQVENIDTGEIRWFNTTYDLPKKNTVIAAKTHKDWLNDHVDIDQIKNHVVKILSSNFNSNSKFLDF